MLVADVLGIIYQLAYHNAALTNTFIIIFVSFVKFTMITINFSTWLRIPVKPLNVALIAKLLLVFDCALLIFLYNVFPELGIYSFKIINKRCDIVGMIVLSIS